MKTQFISDLESPTPPEKLPSPEKPEPPLTPPPLEPEEAPVIVHDHGTDTDEEHDIDKTAGDEGIDDDEGDDFDKARAS